MQAKCTSGNGRASPADLGDTSVLAVKGKDGKTKSVLVVNHRDEISMVSIDAGSFKSAVMWVVDAQTSMESGPTMVKLSSLDNISLSAFATVVISITN